MELIELRVGVGAAPVERERRGDVSASARRERGGGNGALA
jgi:hypothetical protein